MIKKLAVLSAFASATFVPVPTANASPGLCMAQYQEDLAACGGNTSCEMWADVVYTQCLQGLYDTIDPEP